MSSQLKRTPVTQEQLDDLLGARGNTDQVPILKHKAENRVMRELKEVAIRACDDHLRALAECAQGRMLSVVWHCRAHSKAIDECMRAFGQDESLKDEMRRRHGAKYPSAIKGYKKSSNIKDGDMNPS